MPAESEPSEFKRRLGIEGGSSRQEHNNMSYFYWIMGLSFAILFATTLEIYASRNAD